jgi:hypothetical protein
MLDFALHVVELLYEDERNDEQLLLLIFFARVVCKGMLAFW